MKEFTLGKPQGSKPHRSRETIFLYHKDGTPFDLESLTVPGGVLDLSDLDHDQVIAWVDGATLTPRDDGGLALTGGPLAFPGDPSDEYAIATLAWDDDAYGLLLGTAEHPASLVVAGYNDLTTAAVYGDSMVVQTPNPEGGNPLNQAYLDSKGLSVSNQNPGPYDFAFRTFHGEFGSMGMGIRPTGEIVINDGAGGAGAEISGHVGGGLELSGGKMHMAADSGVRFHGDYTLQGDPLAYSDIHWDEDYYGLVVDNPEGGYMAWRAPLTAPNGAHQNKLEVRASQYGSDLSANNYYNDGDGINVGYGGDLSGGSLGLAYNDYDLEWPAKLQHRQSMAVGALPGAYSHFFSPEMAAQMMSDYGFDVGVWHLGLNQQANPYNEKVLTSFGADGSLRFHDITNPGNPYAAGPDTKISRRSGGGVDFSGGDLHIDEGYGLILEDVATASKYRVQVVNGVLGLSSAL